MKCWPEDGGAFLTLPVIHTRDPHTGIRNVGLYRMQVFDKDLTAMHWHKHKVSAKHFMEYKKLKLRMPVSVSLGGDPVYTYAATAPLPENVDEYMLAGFIRKKKVELVKCLTNDLEVPADADFVIEGYIDPDEDLILEGPFGDHTGYYSLADFYPKFHITCITHKKNPVYPSTIVGIPPQEDAWLGKATERIFLAPIKMTLIPEIMDMEMPVEGVFHNLTVVKIKKEYAGQAQKVTHAMWGAGQMMFNKILIVVDETANITNYHSLAETISANVDPQHDIYFSQGPMDVLDHSCSKFAFGGKMCVDGTKKFPEELRMDSGTAWERELPASEEFHTLKTLFPEIQAIGLKLITRKISALILSIEKNRKNHISGLSSLLFELPVMKSVKFVFVTEENVDVNDLNDVAWRISNNMDPRRDCIVIPAKNKGEASHIVLDGTRKTKKLDDFDRPWPNIICSDEQTIAAIDSRWNSLGLGDFIPSPSLKYRKQIYNSGAVVQE
jgi:4-hydroxy-3-polyprenylbenzoate decarboxylase